MLIDNTEPRPYMDSAKKSAVVSVLEYFLDASFVNQEQSSLASFGSGRHVIFISNGDLPDKNDSSESNVSKIRLLLAQRMEQEVDRVRYCISTYNRTQGGGVRSCDKAARELLSLAVHQAVMTMVVQILVEATCGNNTLDLFTSYDVSTTGTHGDLSTFIDCVLGWSAGNSSSAVMFPPVLFTGAMKCANSTTEGKAAVIELIKSIASDIKNIKRPDEILTNSSKSLESLRILLAEPSINEIIGDRLLEEVKTYCSKGKGSCFEQESVFGSLLSLTTIIPSLNTQLVRQPWYSCFTSLRGFPTPVSGDFEQCQDTILEPLHRIQSMLHSCLKQLLKLPAMKNNVLTWMAALVSLNELRAGPKFELKQPLQLVASDGFFVNFSMVLLEFCRPFFSSHPSGSKLHLISPQYPVSPLCRLDLHNEPCLASGMIKCEDRLAKDYQRFLSFGSEFKFVTECFFVTLRALHIGLLPAADTFLKGLGDISKEIDRKGEDKVLKDLFGLQLLAGSCCLLDQQLIQLASEFYITLAAWLVRLLESCQKPGVSDSKVQEEQQVLFSSIPEHGVKDMVRWFIFVIRVRPKLLHGIQLTPVIDCCIGLLERPDLLPGPVAQSRIVSLLLACIGRDTGNQQNVMSVSSWGNVLGELSALVQGSPAFQGRLGPALIQTYSAVGFFEGLDVDKEDFDKYSARYDIAQLLSFLWSRADCRESILQQTHTKKFELFLGAIFDTLLYQVNDSLSRILNIHKIEAEKENAEAWQRLRADERLRKEALLNGEQRAAKGFLKMGTTLLRLLVQMTEVDSVTQHFCRRPLSVRSAGAMMGFLDNLCGARHSELKVSDPVKLGFDPRQLVTDIASVVVSVWLLESSAQGDVASDGFTSSVAQHPDYNRSIMSKVQTILQRHQLCGANIVQGYDSFLEKLDELSGGPGDPLVTASHAIGQDSVLPPPGTIAPWQQEAESVTVDPSDYHEMYVGALADSKYDSAELEEVHTLRDKMVATLDPRSPRVRAILRDVKQLQESLPIHPDSSVFVRQDEERMDLVRVLITGPVDTPYSYGCFVFDIYYPVNYPVNPPLVVLATTGNGTIRFNPNLYADGKVCLSLLGTWHGGDSSEKWDPERSNLMQVLVSIQGLILIPHPIYNEPGYEAMQRTPQGEARSAQYNAYVQINTVRYAMVEQLKNPPEGFEDTVKIHFMLLRDSVLKQCSKWLRGCVSVDHENKLRRAVDQLREELEKL